MILCFVEDTFYPGKVRMWQLDLMQKLNMNVYCGLQLGNVDYMNCTGNQAALQFTCCIKPNLL